MGRVRPTNPLNSLPETCRSSWDAIQLSFVYTGSQPSADVEPVDLAAANQPFLDQRPRRVNDSKVREMPQYNIACSASSVGARTSALRGAVC